MNTQEDLKFNDVVLIKKTHNTCIKPEPSSEVCTSSNTISDLQKKTRTDSSPIKNKNRKDNHKMPNIKVFSGNLAHSN